MTSRERFGEIAALADDAIDLAEAALLIEERPGLSVAACLARLDALAEGARPSVSGADTPLARAAALLDFLFQQERMVGNQNDYYDPRNSFLGQVLERRTGIPITLSIVYIEVARRLALDVCGVGFPGHFLVRSREDPGVVVDAFHGRVLTRDDCRELLQEALGEEAVLGPEHMRRARPREIVARILTNLKHVHLRREEFEQALSCSDRLLLLLPEAPLELRDRGLIYAKLECFGPALQDLERFAALAGQRRVPALTETLEKLRRRVAQIH